ncbi:arrestin domain-containing protein 17-like [Babylonia areolata]|uniref:arrestin domain-containing protein 17-like n=1 Tax=Babylonia areolata TaxID=304850 RepID=UPI003FD6921A
MGKLTTFRIVVNNEDGIVKAGDTLTGRVRLELRADLQVKDVRISFTGVCGTQWAEAQKSGSMPEMNSALMDPVVAQEVYFSQPFRLWPSDTNSTTTTSTPPPSPPQSTSESDSRTTLTKGLHEMDFEFHVPESSPSSFHGKNGFVQYQLKAVMELPPKRGVREAKVTTRVVTVTSQLDLNDVYRARESVHITGDLKAGALLFPSVDCDATMRLTRKGFTQGEIIPVEFSVHNNSSHAIESVSLVLKMIIQYRAGNRRCESECVLGKSTLGKVPGHKSFEGLDKKLRVPVTCQPSGLPGCNLIDIKYRLELKIKPSSLTFKRLKLHSDVIVGTTSLAASSLHDSPPDYWSCCLPTYEEVIALLPPPYSPNTSCSTRHRLPLLNTTPEPALTTPCAESDLTVTPHGGSLHSTPDSSPRPIKDASPKPVSRSDSHPLVRCSDSRCPPVEESSWL